MFAIALGLITAASTLQTKTGVFTKTAMRTPEDAAAPMYRREVAKGPVELKPDIQQFGRNDGRRTRNPVPPVERLQDLRDGVRWRLFKNDDYIRKYKADYVDKNGPATYYGEAQFMDMKYTGYQFRFGPVPRLKVTNFKAKRNRTPPYRKNQNEQAYGQ